VYVIIFNTTAFQGFLGHDYYIGYLWSLDVYTPYPIGDSESLTEYNRFTIMPDYNHWR
jgi:hypothetical protein